MDGVERIMVLGIFAVIVAILSIAAWGVTNDDGGSAFATDGGVIDRPSGPLVSTDESLQPGMSESGSAGGPAVALQAEGGASSARGGSPADRAPGARRQDSGARPGARPSGGLPLKSQMPRGPELVEGARPGRGQADDPPKLAGSQPVKPAGPSFVQVKVVKGDTVWSIARRHFGEGSRGAQVRLIQQLNPAIDIDNITPGETLRLPAEAPAELVSPPVQAAPGTRLYTIGAGETLWSIAEKQLGDRKRSGELYQLNRKTISDPNKVFEGMTILLPTR